MNVRLCIVLTLLGSTSASILDIFKGLIGIGNTCTSKNWDGLRVRWGLNPFSSAFERMPRTVNDALNENFVKSGSCYGNGAFRGIPYVKDNDRTVILLFDVNGIIAGIQTEIPKEKLYYESTVIPKAFVKVGDKYYLTAYFVPIDSICTNGRTVGDLETTGTGNMLLLQTGNDPDNNKLIPQKESDLTEASLWTDEKCVPTMGKLYWQDITKDMDCDDFSPVFLLYNKGMLNGFGWLIPAKMESSHIIHPWKINYHLFFKETPKCLYDKGELAAIHVFLTDHPFRCNMC